LISRKKVGTAEKNVKSRLLNSALWRYSKRSFGSLHCWEKNEIKVAKRYFL